MTPTGSLGELRDTQLIPHFLMASYLYYHHDISPIPDTDFDQICARLLKGWTKVKHPHKKLISKPDLEAGSGYAIPLHKYPLIVQSAAWHWYDALTKGTNANNSADRL